MTDDEQRRSHPTTTESRQRQDQHGPHPVLLDGPFDPARPGTAQSILDVLPMQLAIVDERGVIVYVNQAWMRFGSENGGITTGQGANYLEACERAGADAASESRAVSDAIRAALGGRTPGSSIDYPCHAPDKERWFRAEVVPYPLPQGSRGAIIIHHEVTAERRAFDALRTSEARLRLLLESEPECVKEMSPGGELVYMNPAGLAMLEASSLEAVCSRPLSEFIHPGDRSTFEDLHQRALRGETAQAEYRIIGTLGTVRTVDSCAAPLRTDGAGIVGVLSVTRDATAARRAAEELSATKRKMEAILGALAEGVHVVDLEGRMVYCNTSASRSFGDAQQTLLRQPAHAAIHHHSADGSPYPPEACPIHKTLRDGRTRRVTDEVFFRTDGTSFPVEYVCTPLLDDAGRVEGAVVSFRDVTDERQTRERLEERSSLLRSAKRLAGMGTWDLDVSTGRLDWSDETLQLFGLTPEAFEATYDAFITRVHPDDREALSAAHQRGLQTSIIEAQYRVVHPDGSVRWLYERGQVVRDEQGQVSRRLGVVMDVTALNTAVAALKASEAMFRQVFTHAAAGIAISTLDGRFLDANQAYCNMLELTPDELRTRDVPTITHPDDRQENLALIGELVAGKRDSFVMEKRYLTRSGRTVWARVSVALLRDADDNPVRLIAVAEDIDEQRRTTDALLKREHMLRVASRVGRLGGWSLSYPDLTLEWSDETRAIHELEDTPPPDLDAALAFYAPEHQPRIRDAINACLHRRAPLDIEAEIITARGRRCWVRTIGEVILDERGAVRCIQGALQDISDRKTFERSLQESERRFREFANAMPVVVWTATADGVLDYTNQPVGPTTETDRQADPAGAWRQVMHPDDLPPSADAWRRAVTDGSPYRANVRLRSHDGTFRWHQVGATPVRDDDGAIVKWYGTMIDIDATRRAEEHARELASELAAAFESITDVLFSVDAQSRFVYANARAARLICQPPDTIPGSSLADAFGPGLRQVICGAVSSAMQRRAPEEIDAQDARTGAWFVGRAYPSERGCVVYLRDDSETRRAREAVKESEERFRLLCRATNDAIWDWDLLTDALWWNEGFETLFGYRREQVEPTIVSWSSRVHPEDHARVVPAVERAIAQGQSTWSGEYRFRCADGSWAYVLDRGHVIRDGGGRAVRMVGGMTDLTERKASEERLAEQAALLENARDAILVRDLEGRLRYVNRRAEELYGWQRDAVLGAPVWDLQFSNDRSAFERANEATRTNGEWTGELEQACADGSVILVEGRWTLLRNAAGEPYGVLAINTDIRERKKLEQQLLRTQRMESIGTLAGGIAHDLNNVLTPILFSIEVLRQGERDPERLEDLASIESCARRGSDMVRQLLMFARGYDGRRVSLALNRVLVDVERMVRETFPKNITLRTSIAPGLWRIEADSTQMNQVMMNLCVNARDAMPSGGTLHVALENVVLDEIYAGMNPGVREGSYVLLRVEDSGQGMPPDVAERVFEPFFTTKAVGKGTGLGLSTTHAIVKSHGGFIHLYTEVGKGTRFHVYVPATPEAVEADRVAADQTGLPRGDGECILVVDDEESIRAMVSRTLQRFGYQVLTAANGAEALAVYAQQAPRIAVVLTDMAMPIMDGPALIIALRSINQSVPIIGSSGLDANGKVAAAMGAGVRHFVAKPYTAETLLRTLRAALDGKRPPEP